MSTIDSNELAQKRFTRAIVSGDGSGNLADVDSSGNLKVNVVTGGGGGTQYVDGAVRSTATGTLLMVDDGTNIQSALGTTAGVLKVDLSATTANSTAVKVDGSAVTQPVSNSGLTNIDVALSTRTKPADQQHTILDSGTLTSITNALPSGTNVIGHVIADTGSTTAVTGNVTVVQPTGTNLHAILDANSGVDIGKLTANQSVNKSQVNAVTVLTGTGATGTGSERVTVAVDSATVAGSATLPTGSNIVGRVGIDQTTPGTTNRVAANLDQVLSAAHSKTNPVYTRITDGTDNISSIVLGSDRYLEVAMVQDVSASTLNSSTANLASGASFTGGTETSLGVAAFQINFFADQKCTIQLQQSTDGTNWDQKGSTATVEFNTGFYRTYQATGSFYRVVITNSGLVATTVLRLQTANCPTVETLPTELTSSGNLKVAVQETVGLKESGGNFNTYLQYSLQTQQELLRNILVELRIHTAFLSQGLNVKDDPILFRNDRSFEFMF